MKLVLITLAFMISFNEIFGQQTLGLNPVNAVYDMSFSSINSFEFNPSNYSSIKDWVFGVTFGGEISSDDFRSNLYQVSSGKRIKNHYFQLRYSPGFQKEFVVKNDQQIIYANENESTLETRYLYKEIFSAGYSYKFSDVISAGFNFRYQNEEFSKDLITTIFSDTIYFIPETESAIFDIWEIDAGLVWSLNNSFKLNFGTVNLLNLTENSDNEEFESFRLKQNKEFFAGLNFNPLNEFSFNFSYESSSAFILGITSLYNFGSFNLGLSASGFHDKNQKSLFAGMNLSTIILTKYFDLSLSWLNYFNNRTSIYNLNEFREKGISSIINNQYSVDKVLLNAVFKLNTLNEAKFKILDIVISKNIYPALSEIYLDEPFAKAKVINLTNEVVEAKPFIQISNFGNEKIYSPSVTIKEFDTVEVNYYLMIPEKYNAINPELTYSNFSISSSNEYVDDEIQKPVIINGINSWDGKVNNLKYFIKRDFDFSVKYSKKILSDHKNVLDSTINALLIFKEAELIFNNFVKNLTYTSDPRASSEYVQYPKQTIELKGGDCDDLSVSYSSFLESIGIETALIDYKHNNSIRHVNVMFNSKLLPEQSYLLGANDTKYFIRKNDSGIDEIWIPVETTIFSNFNEAWTAASAKFNKEALNNFGLLTGKVEIIDVY